MGALHDLGAAGPARRLARFRARKPGRGLDAIPERYRLEFLRLASGSLPAARSARVRNLADRVADRVAVPVGLADPDDPRPMDAWFRAKAPEIVSLTQRMAPRWPLRAFRRPGGAR
jgi:hypothetical protein